MGGQSCKLKVILDGSNAGGLAEAICETTQNLSDEQAELLTDDVAYPIIKEIIKAEHSLKKAQDMLLDVVGYDGPRP